MNWNGWERQHSEMYYQDALLATDALRRGYVGAWAEYAGYWVTRLTRAEIADYIRATLQLARDYRLR